MMLSISPIAESGHDAPPPSRDGRTEEFRRFLRIAIPAGFAVAALEIVLGLLFRDLWPVIAGATTAAYMGLVVVWVRRTLGRRPIERVVDGILLPMFIPIVVSGILQPGPSVLGVVLPIAVAMSYLGRREMRRVTALALISVVVITIADALVPVSTTMPAWVVARCVE